jgi:hypothetical protein
MRRLLGCTFVLALAFGTVFDPRPSDAAGAPVTCSGLKGTVLFSPSIKRPPKPAQVSTITLKDPKRGKLTGCKGGTNGSTGLLSFKVTTKQPENCPTMAQGWTAVGTQTIRWAKGTTSKATLTLKAAKGSWLAPVASGKVTSGPYTGRTVKAAYVLERPLLACESQALANANISLRPNTLLVLQK